MSKITSQHGQGWLPVPEKMPVRNPRLRPNLISEGRDGMSQGRGKGGREGRRGKEESLRGDLNRKKV